MNNESAARTAQIAVLLSQHYPDATPFFAADTAVRLYSAARAAKAWEEARCNYAMTEAQEERGTKRIDRMEVRLNARLAVRSLQAIGPKDPDWMKTIPSNGPHDKPATISLGGDPRGPCASLDIPGLKGDGWGDGFAIY
ncbi:hypothetical protein UFOVP786_24 [uncultured Caudovirales phage]|uniref:Uncharacterized protein n=1 Tax=uncultured Caudovirales phage TaxID=2100421 RepID=A0A6J5NST0_9CAUD|nr:hypothetical protein UFOVP786_24 [uncultured Caudovirales phage]